jgi:hypothetical protein
MLRGLTIPRVAVAGAVLAAIVFIGISIQRQSHDVGQAREFCEIVKLGMSPSAVLAATSANQNKVSQWLDDSRFQVVFGTWHSCKCKGAFFDGKVSFKEVLCVD